MCMGGWHAFRMRCTLFSSASTWFFTARTVSSSCLDTCHTPQLIPHTRRGKQQPAIPSSLWEDGREGDDR